MFTGIVQEIITVVSQERLAECLRVVFTRPQVSDYVLGDSILLDGVCSTIVAITPTTVAVEYMPQTVQLTTVEFWRPNKSIHCEPPLTLQTKLSGAFVLGHIDTTATLKAIETAGQRVVLEFTFTDDVPLGYVWPQGAITLNGVNLTVVECESQYVRVHLIPFTFQHTTFGVSCVNDAVNVEFDYFAKLVSLQTQARIKLLGDV